MRGRGGGGQDRLCKLCSRNILIKRREELGKERPFYSLSIVYNGDFIY